MLSRRLTLTFAWCASIAASSVLAADAPQIDIPYEKFTLDNGLRVIVHEDRKAPIVAVGIWYHVGSKNEKPGKTGFAHLFEHLMFNGTENYDDEYFKPLEAVGATGMNGTTWYDRTNYYQNVPTPALELALWLESDRMGHLLGVITEEKLTEQRGVVQNEKRQGDSQPYGTVEYRIQEGLYPPGHPYRWSTIGSMEDLDAASLEDVQEWFRTYYGAANAVLVLAGDVDAATARPLVQKYFGDIDAGPPLERMKSWVPTLTENRYEQMHDRVPQERIYRSWTVPGRLADEASYLNLAASVLGSGKNSRLHRELVYDKQLATSASASLETHELASIFNIDVTLAPGADREEVIASIDRLVSGLLAKGPTRDELERATTKINASVIRGLEVVGGIGGKAGTLARGELYAGDPGYYKQQLARTVGATPKQVQQTAQRWLSKGYHQLTVLPYAQYQAANSGADRSALPQISQLPDLVFPPIERARLDNGIEVVLARRDTVPVVSMTLQFDAGYAADSGGVLGTSSFAMSMLDEGTSKRDALQISAEQERLGARIRSGSDLDVSTVSLSALKDKLAPSIELFADIVRNPVFAQDEIDRLRQRWLAGIAQEKVSPVGIALRTLPPLLYGKDHAYGIPFSGSGTVAAINALTRDDLMAFHRTWLTPANARLFVAGDITMDEALAALKGPLGSWRDGAPRPPSKNIAQVTLPDGVQVYLIDQPEAPQSLILAGHLAPPTGAKENLQIETMNEILGGSFTARVNMNLREDKGWAYGASTLLWDASAQRPWMIYAPVQTDRTADSIAELKREMREYLGDRPATAEELQKVVRKEVRSLPGRFETAGAVLGAMLANSRYGRPDDFVTTLKARYDALSLAQVHDSAQAVLQPEKLTWVIVGDLSQIEQPVRDLNLGQVHILTVD